VTKGPDAFRTISEAADELNVPQHVLRFWETRFSFIRPMKRAGGRRFYRPQDIEVLRAVRTLLHDKGYAIKGVQQLHKDGGMKGLLSSCPAAPATETVAMPIQPKSPASNTGRRQGLVDALEGLLAAKRRLDGLLGT
jgi:DNA-binding transcriptional MerR regulator